MFKLNKFSLVIITRCNLRCRLCCEYVPQNRPFPDMTIQEESSILDAFFQVTDHVNTLHLTGGGEPFLHPYLSEMVDVAMGYAEHFDNLMLFTNSTVPLTAKLINTLIKHKEKIIVQVSQYGKAPEKEAEILNSLQNNGINCKSETYYGSKQSFDGWVDFGPWVSGSNSQDALTKIFQNCSVTKVLHGNWRTRDGKVHWCSRSQRGMDLGLLPDNSEDYIDLFDKTTSAEEKALKFTRIEKGSCIMACDYCSGALKTNHKVKRYPAAEQLL